MKRLLLTLSLTTPALAESVPGRVSFYVPTGAPSACGPTRAPGTQIALSRNLLRAWGCGARVRVIYRGRSYVGVAWDAMAARYVNAADVLIGSRRVALDLGAGQGRIERLR